MRLRRASRGALVATRFTRSETPAVCPRWLRWLRHGHVAGRSLPLASPGVKRQLSVRDGWLGVIGEPGSVARWLERELRAALPLGTRLLRRKIFLGFLKIPKVFYALFSGYYGKLSLTILSFPPSLPPGKLRHFFLLFPLTCPLE